MSAQCSRCHRTPDRSDYLCSIDGSTDLLCFGCYQRPPCNKGTKGSKGTFSDGKGDSPVFDGPLVTGTEKAGPLVTKTPRVDFGAGGLAAVSRLWGGDGGMTLPCPLPGHTGSAELVVDEVGELVSCCRGRLRPLGEVRRARAAGKDEHCTNIMAAAWVRLLAFEAGVFSPVWVDLPGLPADAPPSVRRLASGFRLLIGLRWADAEPRGVAYSVRFATLWADDVSFREASAGLRYLQDRGVIVPCGFAGKGRYRSTLFLPGVVS